MLCLSDYLSGTLLHKSSADQRFPFPRTDPSHRFSDRDAECGVAVQDGDVDLEFRNVAVVPPPVS